MITKLQYRTGIALVSRNSAIKQQFTDETPALYTGGITKSDIVVQTRIITQNRLSNILLASMSLVAEAATCRALFGTRKRLTSYCLQFPVPVEIARAHYYRVYYAGIPIQGSLAV